MKITDSIRKQINDFLNTEGGAFILEKYDIMIDEKHKQAEEQPELSRDYIQSARGIRLAKSELIADGTIQKERRKRV